MELLVILTLSKPSGAGMAQTTIIRTVTAAPGTTRAGMLSWALQQAPEHLQQGANVLFFSVEPNALVAPVAAEAVSA